MKIIFSIFLFVIICAAKPFSEAEVDDRIVGGVATDISVHPYQVSLRNRRIDKPERDFAHNCGGSIYDKWTIITAAHCVIGKIVGQMKIVAGSNYATGTSGVIVPVAESIYHDQYDPETLDYDAAILILAEPLPLNNFSIKAIELSDKENYPSGADATLSGWGTLQSGGKSPYKLRSVQVAYIDRESCQKDYNRIYKDKITERMICGGIRGVGGKDTCQGDSGGPFVIDNKLAGIVSWGRGCASKYYPGVYTHVNYFVPWFKEKIADAKRRHNII